MDAARPMRRAGPRRWPRWPVVSSIGNVSSRHSTRHVRYVKPCNNILQMARCCISQARPLSPARGLRVCSRASASFPSLPLRVLIAADASILAVLSTRDLIKLEIRGWSAVPCNSSLDHPWIEGCLMSWFRRSAGFPNDSWSIECEAEHFEMAVWELIERYSLCFVIRKVCLFFLLFKARLNNWLEVWEFVDCWLYLQILEL